MTKPLALAFLLGLLAAVAPAHAGVVAFGATSGNSAGDCTPSCTPHLQMLYNHAGFGSAPVAISGISLFLQGVGAANTQTYTITLSTSRNTAANMSSNFGDNTGADAQLFYSGVPVASTTGAWFTFSGTPFVYDPRGGDLLVDIEHPFSANNMFSSYDGYASEEGSARLLSFFAARAGGGGPGYTMAAQFNIGAVEPIPEPSTWAMMLIGFAGLGFAARRASRKAAASAYGEPRASTAA